jgi:signal transduction histidine kinase/ActR/RegA family two-component response regulator
MNNPQLVAIIVLSVALIASSLVCFVLVRRLRTLQTQQGRWKLESRRWRDLQGTFLANMSHELRTPLTVIKGYIDLMKTWASDDKLRPNYGTALATMQRNEQFLEDLLNSVLNFSKIKGGLRPVTKERVDIDAIFSDILPGLEEKAESANLFFHVNVDKSLPKYLYFDVIAVKQIARNLVENAVKFTSHGGITMEVKWLPPAGIRTEGELLISVIDTGVGIEASDLDRIFEPFTQAESSMSRRYGGAGLGLSIARGLAENMGGTLTVKSRPGVGSSFELRLPAVVVPGDVPSQTTLKEIAPKEAPKRILLVEDSEDAQELVRRFLDVLSAEIVSVGNGKEAVDAVTKAEREHQGFDVILMDMQTPVMNGFQATRILRQRGYKKPIIALTAHGLEGDREKCMEVGCSDYISKPIDWGSLIQKLAA